MYRHDRVAAHAHIECLRTRVGELAARLEASERERARSEAALDRLREGIGHDPGLPADRQYRFTLHGLRILGVMGLCGVAAVLVPLFLRTFEDPLLSWQGVLNLAYHFREGDGFFGLASAGAIVALGSPWLALPGSARSGCAASAAGDG